MLTAIRFLQSDFKLMKWISFFKMYLWLLNLNDDPQALPVKEEKSFLKFVDSDGNLLVAYNTYGILNLVYINQYLLKTTP